MLRLSLLALALAAVGCASDPADEGPATAGAVEVQSNESADATAPELRAEVDTTGPARVTLADATVPTRGVVTDMVSGDVSCYLTLRTDGGATETVHADYSVCDSDAILDHRVQIEYVAGQVAAASCEGDPECLDTETVPLAVVAEPIDG